MTYTKPREGRLATYGITDEQFTAMWYVQNGQCKICDAILSVSGTGGSAIDHCHISGKVRGLLCTRCNVTLGNIETVGFEKYSRYLSTDALSIGGVVKAGRKRSNNLGRALTSNERVQRHRALKRGLPDPFL